MVSLEQYQAVRSAAGIVDWSSRGRLLVRGRDRASYLNGILTNDIAALKPGTGCYSAYLTPQGRMITDMHVLELGELIMLDVPRAVKDLLAERLDQFIFSEDVQVGDVTGAWLAQAVHGPASPQVVATALAGERGEAEVMVLARTLAEWGEYDNRRLVFRGEPVVVVAARDLGEIGFAVYAEHGCTEHVRAALVAGGAAVVGPETEEVLRVEAGRPAFGIDMDQSTIPLEAGIEDRAISFTKGCYVGQEVILRVTHRGHGRVARKLVGLVLAGSSQSEETTPALPAAGDSIEAAGGKVGHITSAVFSPAAGSAIALGYVHRDYTGPGTAVAVVHDEVLLSAVVAALPFRRDGK